MIALFSTMTMQEAQVIRNERDFWIITAARQEVLIAQLRDQIALLKQQAARNASPDLARLLDQQATTIESLRRALDKTRAEFKTLKK